jgi:hypothetical protein
MSGGPLHAPGLACAHSTSRRLAAFALRALSTAAGIALCIAISSAPSRGADDGAERVVQYRDGRLTVRLSKAPVDEVLAEVAKATGAEIRGRPAPREVTAAFTDVPLAAALERLLGRQNFMLRYADGRPRIIDVVGTSSATPLAGSSGTPAIVSSLIPTIHATPARSVTPDASPVPRRGSVVRMETEMQRHPPLPIGGRLSTAFGGARSAKLDELMKAALNHEQPGVRSEALRVGLKAIEADPALREAFIAWFNSMDDATAATGLRNLPGAHSDEFLSGVARMAQTEELRARASSILDTLRHAPVATPGG